MLDWGIFVFNRRWSQYYLAQADRVGEIDFDSNMGNVNLTIGGDGVEMSKSFEVNLEHIDDRR
jgi:hypothetical protein